MPDSPIPPPTRALRPRGFVSNRFGWVRFTLRGAFVALAILSIVLTFWLQYRGGFARQRQIVNGIAALAHRATAGQNVSDTPVVWYDGASIDLQFGREKTSCWTQFHLQRQSGWASALYPSADLIGVAQVDISGGDAANFDAIVPRLLELASIQSLNISMSGFGDRHLAGLSKLSHLTGLSLIRCEVSDAGVEHVSKVRTLEGIYLNAPKVTDNGIRYLAALPKLRRLAIAGVDITGQGIELLPVLKELTLDVPAGFSSLGYQALSKSTTIETLTIDSVVDIVASDAACLAAMPSLRQIAFLNVPLTDAALRALCASHTIESIDLLGPTDLTAYGFSEIARLPLRSIVLLDQPPADGVLTEIAAVKSLRELYVGSGTLSDHDVKSLSEMKQLTTLRLPRKSTSPLQLKSLRSQLPSTDVDDNWGP